MKQAVIRIGRLYNGEVDIPAGVKLYQRGAMKPILDRVIPVIVDHDLDQQIGVVDELVEWDGGEWLAARCKLTVDEGWPRVGSGASLGYKTLQRQQIGAGERILSGLVEEITVTLEMTPRTVGARIDLIQDIKPRSAKTTPPRTRQGEIDDLRWIDALVDEGMAYEDAWNFVVTERGYGSHYLSDPNRRRRIAA